MFWFIGAGMFCYGVHREKILVPTMVMRGQYDGIASFRDLTDFFEKLPIPTSASAENFGTAAPAVRLHSADLRGASACFLLQNWMSLTFGLLLLGACSLRWGTGKSSERAPKLLPWRVRLLVGMLFWVEGVFLTHFTPAELGMLRFLFTTFFCGLAILAAMYGTTLVTASLVSIVVGISLMIWLILAAIAGGIRSR